MLHLDVPSGNGSPASSEGALSPFESEGNNHLSVSLVERLKAEVCKTSRANCPHGGSNPSRHSNGDVAQRLVQSLHKAFVGGPNPPIATSIVLSDFAYNGWI